MQLGKEGVSVAALLRNQLPLGVESPGKRALLNTIQTGLSRTTQIRFAEKAASFITDCNQAFSSRLAFCKSINTPPSLRVW